MLRILSLSPYPIEGASARYRTYAFQKGLAEKGIELTIRPFLTPDIFKLRNRTGNKNIDVLMGISDGFISRFVQAATARFIYDGIYIHRQAFPLFHRYFDQLIIKSGLPIIFDMDDAVFTEYPIDHLLERCSAITVGNNFLAEYARKKAPNVPVTVVPTALDLDIYTLRDGNELSNGYPIIGWIGTESTFERYLLPVLPALVKATQQGGGEFRVIGDPRSQSRAEAVGAVFIPWKLETELAELKRFDVGVMPLRDDEYVRGKCAFKLIQYGAVGIPSIGTNIGANSEVISEGVSGYLTDTNQQMEERIAELLGSRELRLQMGVAARQIIEERFSLQSQVNTMAEVFKEAVLRKGNVRN